MSENTDSLPPAKGQFLIYPAENGRLKIEVPLENETVWLNQQHMADLFHAVATRFRIWATQKLREFIVKGFVLDDERLKNPDQLFDYCEGPGLPRIFAIGLAF